MRERPTRRPGRRADEGSDVVSSATGMFVGFTFILKGLSQLTEPFICHVVTLRAPSPLHPPAALPSPTAAGGSRGMLAADSDGFDDRTMGADAGFTYTLVFSLSPADFSFKKTKEKREQTLKLISTWQENIFRQQI